MQGTKTAQKRKETLLLRKKRVGFHYKPTAKRGRCTVNLVSEDG